MSLRFNTTISSSPLAAARAWARRMANARGLFPRCSAAQCPEASKLWPSVRRRASGRELGGRWYCGEECLAGAVQHRVERLLAEAKPAKPRTYRVPIGLLLVSRRMISDVQLKEALRKQREAGRGRLGEWLQRIRAVSAGDLTAALGVQWGCPVFPLDAHEKFVQWSSLLPFPLLQAGNMVPVHFEPESRRLHLAFAERIDHTALYAVEQMLGCTTLPSIAEDRSVLRALERLAGQSRGDEICFDSISDSAEIGRTILSYAGVLGARRVRIERALAHVWARLEMPWGTRDILFRMVPQELPAPLPDSLWELKFNEKRPMKESVASLDG
jgi:hypothetical protein